MSANTDSFLKLARHSVKFRMFLFYQLPSAYFSGVKVKKIDASKCVTAVRYKWFTKNPFRSTYFACLAMAAEMSTGLLALLHTYKNNPPISMLVVRLEVNYFKKATGTTTFTCADGVKIEETISRAISTGDGQTITAKSTGKNEQDELVAEFLITWSFKVKRG